jgi:hypothetical protein
MEPLQPTMGVVLTPRKNGAVKVVALVPIDLKSTYATDGDRIVYWLCRSISK